MTYRSHKTVVLFLALTVMPGCKLRLFQQATELFRFYPNPALRRAQVVHRTVSPVTPPKVQVKKMRMPHKPDKAQGSGDSIDVLEVIDQANTDATESSVTEKFVLSTHFFDYVPGQVYEAVASPGFITTLALKPGERLTSVASGDTHLWQVQQTQSGSRPPQTLVLIKPMRKWLETNLVLTTDQRVYQVALKSVPGGIYNTTVAWRYPSESLVQHVGDQATHRYGGLSSPAPVQVSHLDMNYNIKPVAMWFKPRWTPDLVYNDGLKTYIQFPDGNRVAPALFVHGPNGMEMVNYRVHRNYYIVDKVLDHAELRLGPGPRGAVRVTHRANHKR